LGERLARQYNTRGGWMACDIHRVYPRAGSYMHVMPPRARLHPGGGGKDAIGGYVINLHAADCSRRAALTKAFVEISIFESDVNAFSNHM
jgi:hypothetical protein